MARFFECVAQGRDSGLKLCDVALISCADPLPQGIALRLAIFKRLAQRRDGRLQVADLPIRVTTCLAIGNGFKVGHDHASFVGRLVLNQFPQARPEPSPG